MNEKVTQPRLITLLAELSGGSKKNAEEFLKAFVNTLTDAVSNHESVKIKGLGTFKVSKMEARKSVNVSTGDAVEIPSHYKVTFVPDKKVAAAVNAPFDIFETVELDDAIEETELQNAGEVDEMEETAPIVSTVISGKTMKPDEPPMVEVTIGEEDVSEPEGPAEETTPAEIEETPVKLPEPAKPDGEAHEVGLIEMNSHDSKSDEEEKSEDLGEKLEEDFGPIEPAEPFGPISPDDPDVDEVPEDIAAAVSPEPERIQPEPVANADTNLPVLVKNESSRSFGKGLLIGIVATFFVMLFGFGLLYYLMINKLDSFMNDKREEIAQVGSEPQQVVKKVPEIEIEEEPVFDEGSNNDEVPTKVSEAPKVEEKEPVPVEEKKQADLKKEQEKADKKEAPAPVAKKPKIDTISTTRFLGTMAREHYGDYNLWPYIYMENSKKIGHPDRIRPGTKIVIPDLSKYNVSPNNPADIEKAKKMGVEIYNRYKNS